MFNGRRRFSMGETTRRSGGVAVAGAVAMPAGRREQIGVLYERQAETVRRLVRRRVRAPEGVVEDACQTAWLRLCAHEDVALDARSTVKWLVITAVRESWRRTSRLREVPVGGWGSDPDEDELPEPVGCAPDPCELTVGRDEVRRRLAALTARERQFLALQAFGLNYEEISVTLGVTVRTVERQILRWSQEAPLPRRPMMSRGVDVAFPAPAGTQLFLAALYGSAPSGSLVEVRFRTASGMGCRFDEVGRLDRVGEMVLSLAARTDVYVGVLPRRRRGGRRADLVEAASVVWVDCDNPRSVAALRRLRRGPGMVVASGSGENRHAYWFLTESIELDAIERINRGLALALGADGRCSDPARILRPVGSVNRKHVPPAAVGLLKAAENERVSVGELEPFLLEDPRELRVRRTRRCASGEGDDPLAVIPPRVYFERLTGQRVGRSGKTSCPFHEDRTPSLHVYDDPERGWYCFGCGLGGSIYDLGALLWRRGTRGRDFVALRRELEARMGVYR
jgi:RNA polymerase sigma factor (sigma-70 family)